MNIGIDIHGVIDKDPEKWKLAMKMYKHYGINVYIISGPSVEQCIDELEKLGFYLFDDYQRIYSIIDTLEEMNDPDRYLDENGHIWTKKETWDSIKGLLCYQNNIKFMYDDTLDYKKYMPEKTVFIYMGD